MITRMAIYVALGLLLSHMGYNFDSIEFWCVVGLFWATEHLARVELIDDIHTEVERIRAERKDNNK